MLHNCLLRSQKRFIDQTGMGASDQDDFPGIHREGIEGIKMNFSTSESRSKLILIGIVCHTINLSLGLLLSHKIAWWWFEATYLV